MRKISLPLLVALLAIVSCQKAIRTPEETDTDATSTAVGRKCASQEVLESQIQANPERGRFLEELEIKTAQYQGRNQGLFRGAAKLYVPVVVNVITANASQVTTAQIQSQLDVLNKDYNKTNSELANSSVYLAGFSYANLPNCNLEFYIQNPATDIRRKNSSTSFGSDDAVKKTSRGGLDPLSASTKLNVWVCTLGGGLLGYAQFPGGSAASDGVVINYQAFGTTASYPLISAFNKGRTATHEVGHWLNLRHIWGDRRCGNDGVGDTPGHDGANVGCPSSTLRSSCTGRPLEQWMNYMDYTDDACMYMFSAGQKTRMDAAIDAARAPYMRTAK